MTIAGVVAVCVLLFLGSMAGAAAFEVWSSGRRRVGRTTVQTTFAGMHAAAQAYLTTTKEPPSADPVERWIQAGGDQSLDEYLARECGGSASVRTEGGEDG